MIPLGAIHNGRAFIERIQNYGFKCEGGPLENCGDWEQLVSCFEHLSEWAESQTAAIPEGYALVPTSLTAENGAKAALIGEFYIEITRPCQDCDGQGYGESDAEDDECEHCQGTGDIGEKSTIDWTTIKEIWAAGIAHFKAAKEVQS